MYIINFFVFFVKFLAKITNFDKQNHATLTIFKPQSGKMSYNPRLFSALAGVALQEIVKLFQISKANSALCFFLHLFT